MTNIQSLIGGRTENQDFYGTAQTQYGELIIVCDGMGGHNGGRHAAEVAVHTVLEEMLKSKDANPATALQSAITTANAAIWNESLMDKSLKGMGTTMVALLITPEKAISCHVGDSRIYQLRKGEILFRTFDHSHVFEMVKAGLITEEQARLSEKSNIITRALGIKSTVEIEITNKLSYQKGDRFLLCTDGIWGVIPETELVKLISEKDNVEAIVGNLVTKINALGVANGNKHDNLTAALVEIEVNSSIQTAESKNVIAAAPRSTTRAKWLIYLLLIVLLGSLAVNVYLLTQKNGKAVKIEKKVEKKKVIVKLKTAVNQSITDTTTATPAKK